MRSSQSSRILARAALSGSVASVASIAAAAAAGWYERGRPAAPVNAISHWIWDTRAFAHERPTLRHTLLGYAIHHAMSVFWAMFFEARRAMRHRPGPAALIGDGLGVAATACFVDYQLTPERLKPGYEHKLSRKALAAVYVSFGIGLVLAHLLAGAARRDKH